MPWVRVCEEVEQARFAEAVEHVEGTMVAFLRKAGDAAGRPGTIYRSGMPATASSRI